VTQAAAQQDSVESPPRSATPYELLGGSDVVSAIANRFYELMDSEPQYAELRALHRLQPRFATRLISARCGRV